MNNYPQSSFSAQNNHALEVRSGQCFQYVIPQGWQVAEDGQFAVVLFAPNNDALTIMVGNSGFPLHYNPSQYVYDRLMAMQPQQLQMSQPRQAQPISGCTTAYEYDYTYTFNGIPCQGLAKCSIAYSYDMCTMVVTSAASHTSQWAGYASWLPQVANQVSATNGAAFGMRGIMSQNINNSIIEGEIARENRREAQRNWDEATRQRGESIDRQNVYFRENLGNVQTWTNPYGYPTVELPTTHSYYWTNSQGQIYGTDNPSENPNVGTTESWMRMNRHQP
jgi:hypothetical protein